MIMAGGGAPVMVEITWQGLLGPAREQHLTQMPYSPALTDTF